MYQAPATTWNAIAKAVPLAQPENRRLFSLNQATLLSVLQEQADRLAARGISPKVIKAYQTLGPLLMENEALTAYCVKTGNLALREMLPELVTTAEALHLAQQEYRLTVQECEQLKQLLDKLPH